MSFLTLSLRQVVNRARISKGSKIIDFRYSNIGSLNSTSFVRNSSSRKDMAKALVIVADGTEEMEAVSELILGVINK